MVQLAKLAQQIASIAGDMADLQRLLYGIIGVSFSFAFGVVVFIWRVDKAIRNDSDGKIEALRRAFDQKIDGVFDVVGGERIALTGRIDDLNRQREENKINIAKLSERMDRECSERQKDVQTIVRTCRGCNPKE